MWWAVKIVYTMWCYGLYFPFFSFSSIILVVLFFPCSNIYNPSDIYIYIYTHNKFNGKKGKFRSFIGYILRERRGAFKGDRRESASMETERMKWPGTLVTLVARYNKIESGSADLMPFHRAIFSVFLPLYSRAPLSRIFLCTDTFTY